MVTESQFTICSWKLPFLCFLIPHQLVNFLGMCCVVVVFFIQNKVIIYLLSNLNLIYHHFLVFNFWSDLFLLVFSEFYFSNSTENLLQLVAFVHQNQCVTQFARQELFHEIDSQNGDLKLPKHDQVLRSRELKQHERILRTSFILLFLIFFSKQQLISSTFWKLHHQPFTLP